ncbi:MAG: HD domain-containing protein [Gammaproteobacteria bacterium]|nr:HD domain-containing protein [Gammaproteobacteria bacterium]
MNILENAKKFAIDAHESINQKRKYTDEPYHIHCERVVEILSKVITDEEILAAAWMHDILEDVTPHNEDYSEEKIRNLFGDRICNIVIKLTDSKLEDGNRAARKARDRMRLESASIETKTIKLADLTDNFIDIQKNDPGFAMVIAREMELLLPCLAGGDSMLFSRLSELINDFQNMHKPKLS